MIRTRARNRGGITSGGTSLPSYVGAFATGGRVANLADTNTKYMNARSPHIARSACTRLKIAVANWWVNFDGEHAGLGASTFEAFVEYPAGTFTRIQFSGIDVGACAAGSTLESDWCTVSIPKDALFWIRVYQVNASGCCFTNFDTLVGNSDTAFGALLEVSTTPVSNKAGGGTIPMTYAPLAWMPLAVVSDTTEPTALIIGDSISWGQGDSYDGVVHALGYTERSISPYFGCMNMAEAGEQAGTFYTAGSRRAAMAQYCSHVLCEYGINDIIVGGFTAAQTKTNVQNALTLFNSYPTVKKVLTTLTSVTTSTDSWASSGNQTKNSHCTDGGDRDTYNGYVTAKTITGQTDYIDLTSGAFTGNLWKSDGTANKYTTDGIHPARFSAKAMAALFTSSSITR